MPELIDGEKYLARLPDFRLKGRDADLRRLASILMRKSANSVIMVGPGGVGCSALCLGLQAMKSQPDASFDVVSKRLFWLDPDALFSSGDSQQINAHFQKMLSQLARIPDTILVIDDSRAFMDACKSSGNSHFINALVNSVSHGKTQVILEVRDEDLGHVYKWHSGIHEIFTLMDIQEPTPEFLVDIITDISGSLSKHHGIRIEGDAIKEAIALTTKYRGDIPGLKTAQPDRSVSLLDRALSTYRLSAHEKPPHIAALENRLRKAASDERGALEAQLRDMVIDWNNKREKVKHLFGLQRKAEIQVAQLEDDILALELAKQKQTEVQQSTQQESAFSRFNSLAGKAGFETDEIAGKRSTISALQIEMTKLKEQYNQATAEANAQFALMKSDVVSEFSRITGIAESTLGEDEIAVLRRLDETLKSTIFGQDHVINQVSNGVKVARIGKRNGERPLASYMFLGPSGVGKTEVAKQTARALGVQLLRLDMSEYMEKHAVARMIGAPPGYEGFEAGGILTNAVRKNRRLLILFDEIEKAHPDVFNVLLQVLDAGRLTDNVGRVADFSECILMMTSNIGQTHFLDIDVPFEDAILHANQELEQTYRNEFLNRFNGRQNIICFNRLELPSIERIVRREMTLLSDAYGERNVSVVIGDEALKTFCADHYNPRMGGRGLPGYINANLEPIIVNAILERQGVAGVFDVGYNSLTKTFDVRFISEESEAA